MLECDLKVDSHLAILSLNRPEKLNAISKKLLSEFHRDLKSVETNPSIRCLIITGTGEKSFCVGADLEERRGMSEQEVLHFLDNFRDTLDLLESLPCPTLAAINGFAFGGGLEIALACDIRLMKESSQIGLTETKLGIIPGAGGTQRLTRLIGKSKAMSLIFRGKKINSTEALKLGVVEEVYSDLTYWDDVKKFAEEILTSAPIAVRLSKLAIRTGLEKAIEEGLDIEREYYKQTLQTKDRLEALRAFHEKRTPKFIGE
jgi:enoyl-CoA hydratase/carnithine racemase